MDELKGYPKEFAELFQASFYYLSKMNVKFYFKKRGFVEKYWRFLYTIPCVMILHVTLGVSVAKFATQGRIVEIANLLPPFLICTQAILKFVIIILNNNQLTTLIKDLGDLWRTVGLNEVQINKKNALMKRLRFCIGAIYWITITFTPHFILTPLLETLVRRFILKQDFKMVLPFECSYPLGPIENWLVYGAIYAFQSYSVVLYVFFCFGAEMMMITLCALIGIEFTLLCEDMLNVKPESKKKIKVTHKDNEDVINKKMFSIKDIVRRHQKLCQLVDKLNEVFNRMIFVNLIFVGITTCFFGYAAQFSRGPMYMINHYAAVIGNLLNVLQFCHYGELLTGASLRFGDMAYHNIWYQGDKDYQKIILIIIARSHKPCYLTSLKYAPVTLNMFTKVMSSTWSYFSLMNTVYGGENQ